MHLGGREEPSPDAPILLHHLPPVARSAHANLTMPGRIDVLEVVPHSRLPGRPVRITITVLAEAFVDAIAVRVEAHGAELAACLAGDAPGSCVGCAGREAAERDRPRPSCHNR